MSTTVKAGLWSDPTVWDTPPTVSTDAVVLHNLTIDMGTARRVDIKAGTTTLGGTFHCYASFVVNNGASLVGSFGDLFFHVPDDRAFVGNTAPGPNPLDPDDHSSTDYGLWCLMGGRVDLSGSEVTPWLNAIPVSPNGTPVSPAGTFFPAIRSGVATLESVPVGWMPGDQLCLTSIKGGYALASLDTVNGTDIIYTGADTWVADVLTVEGQSLYPKVANLSRRLRIVSADVTPTSFNHRAHTIFMHSHGCLAYVELRNLGPRAKLGRYPVHFHHGMSMPGMNDAGCVDGCSIWQDVVDRGSRFVAIHNAPSITCTRNVGLRSQGHGFFMESGPEINCNVSDNLSIDVCGPEELTVTDSATSALSHHFWMRSGNTIDHNVAVGWSGDVPNGVAGGGSGNNMASVALIVLAHKVATLPLADLTLTGNEAYGVGRYGFWGLVGGKTLTTVDSKAAYCGQAATGLSFYPHGTKFLHQNPLWAYNGGTNAQYGSQLYANTHKQMNVEGGILCGDTAIDLHYNSHAHLTDCVIRCNKFLVRTYFAFACLVEDCDLLVTSKLILGGYPAERMAPGLLRFQGCYGNVLGTPYTPASVYNADWVPPEPTFNVAGFTGTTWTSPAGEARKLLSAPAPQTGFVKPPPGSPSSGQVWTWAWKPAGTGTYSAKYAVTKQVLADWQASTLLGYPDGFPPGTYDIQVYKPDGTLVGSYPGVVVTAGQITQM